LVSRALEIVLQTTRRLQMANRTVRETMTTNPRAVAPDAPVTEAAQLMRSEDVGSLPVVDGERLVGVVTDRDIAVRVVAAAKDPNSTSVGEIHSKDLVTSTPNQELDDALREMARHQVRRVPVVDDGRLVGILAQADIAREAESHTTGEFVEDVSESTSRPQSS
jgi:CBS domain-containing protein